MQSLFTIARQAKNCLYCLKKKQEGEKQPSCSAFLFSVSCVFKLAFPNCIFPIVFSILAFPCWLFSNRLFPIVFSQLSFSRLSLFSSCKLSYKEDGTCGAFLYDVDEGAGGVKLYMLWLFWGQRHGHDGCCHGCCLGALLVNLDLCLLKHVGDVHGG